MLASSAATPNVFAQALSLPNSPLFVSQNVKPNIIVAIDDSGSMDGENLYINNDGALWWKIDATSAPSACPQGFIGCGQSNGTTDVSSPGRLNFNIAGGANNTWRKFIYLFPNGFTTGRRLYGDTSSSAFDHFAVPPIAAFAWSRAPDYNRGYFDPDTLYTPWTSYNTTTFADATPTAALFDPTRGSGSLDLTQDVATDMQTAPSTTCAATPTSTTANWGFRVFTGMTLPTGTCLQLPARTTCTGGSCTAQTGGSCSGNGSSKVCTAPATWKQLTTNLRVGTSDQAIVGDTGSTVATDTTVSIRYFPAAFYLPQGSALPSGYNYTATPTQEGTSPDGTTNLLRYEIKPANFGNTASYDAAMKNFANWFTYYRKRHLAMRGGVVGAFNGLSNLKLGTFPINSLPATTGSGVLAMKDIDTPSDRYAFYADIYANYVSAAGTPNREAVQAIGQQYQRTDTNAPVQYACQKNFGILFTDGYANAWNNTTYGNADGSQGSPYADTVSNSMADTAMSFYNNPLRTGSGYPAGKVSVPQQCSVSGHAASLDCQTNLHMNFYGVTIGTQGLTFGVNAQQTADPYANPPTWPTDLSQNRNPVAVDDLWHATINGRGQLYNATTPKDISTGFSAVLRSITAVTASASSVSLNTSSLRTTSRVYQATFNSGNWSGDLKSYPIYNGTTACANQGSASSAGDLCNFEWSAAAQIANQSYITGGTGRTILSYKPSTGAGIPFQIGNLDFAQELLLRGIGETDSVKSTLRLRYLRGDTTQDGTTTTPRVRASKLGDIGDSAPFYVGPPNDTNGDSGYQSFRSTYASRDPIIYVGANDGMLHGFRAVDGAEKLAYVPSKAFGSAAKPLLFGLTQTPFTHLPIVNASPTVEDAFVGPSSSGRWRSVLVGGLGAGGRGLYALDVTDPSRFSESNAASLVMWEFTDANDRDLGYTFAQPSIVKMANGRWAAIVGNGYTSTADVAASLGSGQSSLFIIFLDGPGSAGWGTGAASATANYIKIPTGAGSLTSPNALATPAAVDTNGDGLIDYIYAGDLQGKMWRFDVGDSNPANWSVGNKNGSGVGQPLFAATDASGNAQPITERPEVGYNLLAAGATNASTRKLAVYFGTGRYIDTGDTSTVGVQTFYGVFDNFNATAVTINRSDRSTTNALVQQQITGEVNASGTACAGSAAAVSGSCFRATTNRPVTAANYGWYIDLYNTAGNNTATSGERQITTPVLRGGRIIFTTLIPSTDVCSPGGGGWLMELNAKTGGALSSPVFSTNGDRYIDDNDYVIINGQRVAVSGTRSNVGIPATPGIISMPGNLEMKYRAGSGNAGQTLETLVESASGRVGRITWREITP